MEFEALEGAAQVIAQCRPILLIEKIKTDADQLRGWLRARDFTIMEAGINMLAIHQSDKAHADIKPAPQRQSSTT